MINILNLRHSNPSSMTDIRVDRESLLGTPFYLKSEYERDTVCDKYETYFIKKLSSNDLEFLDVLDRIKSSYEQRGYVNLYCWCVPKRCHA